MLGTALQRMLVLVLLGSSLLSGCQRTTHASDDIGVAIAITPAPLTRGVTTITVALSTAGNIPLQGARVTLEGTMSHAGMESISVPAPEHAPGSYRAVMPIAMAGDWIVIVAAHLPDGRTLERPVPIGTVQ